MDFSIKEDFKIINILYIESTTKKRVTLIYNNSARDYFIGVSMELTYASQLHVNYAND